MPEKRGLSRFLVAAALAGCVSAPPPADGLSFALMGDMPYSQAQANLLDGLIEEMNRDDLAFVVHVGDITSGQGPCDDDWLEARKRQFARIRHSFVLLPGDNEWTDCWRGGFDPLERLAKWRSLFCDLGKALHVERQPGRCEHARWQSGNAFFIGLNVPGSTNNLGRTPEMDMEHARRMDAAFEWLDESLARAEERRVGATVILFQANPFEGAQRRREGAPDGYERLRNALRSHASRQPGRLWLVHGDTHVFRDDEPIPGLRRIEVYGSPHVRWSRATLSNGRLTVRD